MKFTLDNIDFEIIKYDIENDYSTQSNIFYNGNYYGVPKFPSKKAIKITAITDNNNYIAVGDFFQKMLSNQHARYYKNDLNFKYLRIYGVFPIDYTFNQYNIEVTFSADYFEGDFELLQKQKMRKEKLKRLNNIEAKTDFFENNMIKY